MPVGVAWGRPGGECTSRLGVPERPWTNVLTVRSVSSRRKTGPYPPKLSTEGTVYERRGHGIRATETAETRYTSDGRHGIRATQSTVYERRSSTWPKSLKAAPGMAFSPMTRVVFNRANLSLILLVKREASYPQVEAVPELDAHDVSSVNESLASRGDDSST